MADDKISFRQAGKEFGGKVVRGPTTDAYNRASQPSIPTNYELLLTQQKSSIATFGTSAKRFDPVFQQAPGPGAYKGGAGAVNRSFSKLGTGNLASKSKRFQPYQFATISPGPGSYQESKLQRTHSMGSRMFKDNSVKELKRAVDLPAPGQYEPKKLNKSVSVTSTFKSKAARLNQSINDENGPTPWQYRPNYAATRSNSAQSLASTKFKTPTYAKRFQINLYDPHAPIMDRATPGPGEYDSAKKPSTPGQSFMFINNSVDRFGKNKNPKVKYPEKPGPQSYAQAVIKKVERQHVSGSVFLSEVVRMGKEKEGKPPGPAFYKPAPTIKKKSFHLNASKQWV